jgi:multiple sugar transport system substrate-binding protein
MRVAQVGLLACTVSLLAACGGVGDGGTGDGGSGGDDTSRALSTMGFGLPDEIATTRIDMFREEFPDVELDVVEGDFDEQQFLSAVASGDVPDLVYLPRTELGSYAARGAITPLDDCIDTAGIDVSQYREPAMQQVTVDGSVYGIPEFYSVRVLIVNDTSAEAAGIDPASVSTGDWDQIQQAATAMYAAEGSTISRIGYDPKLPEFLPLWAAANGAQLLAEDGTAATIDDPAVVEALEFGAGLVEAQGGWGAFKSFRDTWDFFGAANQYASDQLGAMPMEDWYLNVLAESSPDAPVTVVPFRDRNGDPLTYATGSAWAIPDGAANPEDACEFIKLMTSVEAWTAAAEARVAAREAEGLPYTGTYTGNQAADDAIFADVYQPSGNAALDAAVQTVLEVQDYAFSMPPSPAAAEVDQAWKDAAQRVLDGQQSAADALAQAQEEATAALEAAAG